MFGMCMGPGIGRRNGARVDSTCRTGVREGLLSGDKASLVGGGVGSGVRLAMVDKPKPGQKVTVQSRITTHVQACVTAVTICITASALLTEVAVANVALGGPTPRHELRVQEATREIGGRRAAGRSWSDAQSACRPGCPGERCPAPTPTASGSAARCA